MSPRYSIIVPLYNKAPYVRHALESIATQTFRNHEVIIVDDGSTDNSLAVVKEFIERIDDRWTIISQPNAGVAAARNKGVATSHGEYVCFLDADDWWKPEFLEEMDRLIKEYPDAGLYATNYVYYKQGKTRVALNFERGYLNYPEAYLHSAAMPICTISVCMPRRVYDETGGFPEGIKLGEDFLLWAKTALHYKVAYCEKPLAYYNNDVPIHMRATRNLHAPRYHKLFNLKEIERGIEQLRDEKQKELWLTLLDQHRAVELMDYWLSDKYHNEANVELAKVDWSRLSKNLKVQYKMPIWLLKAKRQLKQIGSYYKQKIIRIIHSK